MNNKQYAIIVGVINTLNSLEVKGKDNLDMLLGAILALEKLLDDIKEESEDNG